MNDILKYVTLTEKSTLLLVSHRLTLSRPTDPLSRTLGLAPTRVIEGHVSLLPQRERLLMLRLLDRPRMVRRRRSGGRWRNRRQQAIDRRHRRHVDTRNRPLLLLLLLLLMLLLLLLGYSELLHEASDDLAVRLVFLGE